MLRSMNRNFAYLARLNSIRRFSTSTQPKSEETNFQAEWDRAKPLAEIPGLSMFELFRRFSPGGKYHQKPFSTILGTLNEEFGPIVKFPGMFGRRDIIFTFDPKDFELVYRTEGVWPQRIGMETFTYYRKKVRPEIFHNMGGLLSEQGKEWADLRSKVNPVMLPPKMVKTYIPPTDEVAIDFLTHVIAKRDANNELAADFGNDLNKWSLESIGLIALDQRFGVLSNSDPRAQILVESVRDSFELIYQLEALPSPWKYISTPKFRKLMKTFDNMTDTILDYVNEAVEELKKKEGNKATDREASVLEKLLKIDRHAAVVMTMDMLMAGIDTTSATMVGCLYHLAKNPEKQEKLREEVRTYLPHIGSKLTLDSLNNAPYMRSVLKEAARLSPIIIAGVRTTGQDIVVKGYRIPKGVDVAMGTTVLMRQDKHFPQADQFVPERWLKKADPTVTCPSARTANPFIYLPFGFGPRACIGKRFAEMEVEVLLARIIRQYKLEWNYPPITYKMSIIESPVGDLKFKLTDIED